MLVYVALAVGAYFLNNKMKLEKARKEARERAAKLKAITLDSERAKQNNFFTWFYNENIGGW